MVRMCPAANAQAFLPRSIDGSHDVLPLSLDAAGEAVSDLQSRLVRLGLLEASIATGIFDAETGRAVAAFQRQRGLRCDGVCGRETWAAVVEAGFALGDRSLYRRAPMIHGDDVAELQRRLSALGFDPGGVDGIFGDRTAEALGEFQQNAGLVVDGICGHLTVAELNRLAIRPGGGDLVSSVRERLIASTRGVSLHGRKIAVGEQGGFATGVAAVGRALSGLGAESLQLHHPDESEQAASANRAGVDCYVGLRLEPEHAAVKTMYYRGYRYESETSRSLANLMRSEIAERLGFSESSTEGMAVRILRETQMPAVLIELGDPSLVVMKVAELAQAIVSSLEQWLMVDWEAEGSSTT
jgi:N-acetylmuramoyl-L-alanine amidase